MSENKGLVMVKMYQFGIVLNPILWLGALGSAAVNMATIPLQIYHRVSAMFSVLHAMCVSNSRLTLFQKSIVILAVVLRNLLIDIPCVFLYAAIKMALCFVLVEFDIVRKFIDSDTIDSLSPQEIIEHSGDGVPEQIHKKDDDGSFKA